MSKSLWCLVVMAGFVGSVFAGQSFTDAGPDHLFSTATNWAQGVVPNDSTTHPSSVIPAWHTDNDLVDGAICVIDAPQQTYAFKIAQEGRKATAQIVNDGALTAGGWGVDIGRGGNSTADAGTHGKLFMSGGAIVDTPWINMPTNWAGALTTVMKADLIMQDGVINAGWIQLGDTDYDLGTMRLLGGVINADNIISVGPASKIEVGSGILVINGDLAADFQQYITDGLVVPAPGYSTLELDFDVTNPGKTTLSAISDLNPFPADNSPTASSVTALTWTMPEPNLPGGTVTCDVYFGDPSETVWESLNDPNVEAAYLAAGGVEGDWLPTESGLPLLEAGNTTGSVAVTLEEDVVYCWKVNVFDDSTDGVVGGEPNLVASYIFDFESLGNFAPVVEAGNNLYSFLDGGSRTVTLNGELTADDGLPIPAVPTWSVVTANTPFEDGPQSPISAATYGFVGSADLLGAQFQVTVAGDYTLQLDADDTDLQAVPDTMILFVRDTACGASIIFPGYEPLVGDLVEDCVIDLNDLAVISGAWLEVNEGLLDDTTEYIPE